MSQGFPGQTCQRRLSGFDHYRPEAEVLKPFIAVFELLAAVDLARLYSSTSRSADGHALLASSLEGCSPTPEFPEIAEAQTLLGTLP